MTPEAKVKETHEREIAVALNGLAEMRPMTELDFASETLCTCSKCLVHDSHQDCVNSNCQCCVVQPRGMCSDE